MTPLLLLGVVAAGGIGAGARFLLDGLVRDRLGERLPWGTMLVNLTGSLLLGVVVGVAAAPLPAWALVVGTGFLGGYTTYSTAALETVRLLRQRRWAGSLVAGVAQPAAAVALAIAGLLIGTAV